MIPQPVQRAVMMFELSRLSIFPLEELDRTALVGGCQYSSRAMQGNLTGRLRSTSACRSVREPEGALNVPEWAGRHHDD
jgi:hypothetical protein